VGLINIQKIVIGAENVLELLKFFLFFFENGFNERLKPGSVCEIERLQKMK
jgi:hypothetical protein